LCRGFESRGGVIGLHTVYVLRSLRNGRYYKGFTSRPIEERLDGHNRGYPPGWSSRKLPFELAHVEQFESEAEARARERFPMTRAGREWLKSRLAENEPEAGEPLEP
jgi:predicted GIY-YIG superfamily endonuclease